MRVRGSCLSQMRQGECCSIQQMSESTLGKPSFVCPLSFQNSLFCSFSVAVMAAAFRSLNSVLHSTSDFDAAFLDRFYIVSLLGHSVSR